MGRSPVQRKRCWEIGAMDVTDVNKFGSRGLWEIQPAGLGGLGGKDVMKATNVSGKETEMSSKCQ